MNSRIIQLLNLNVKKGVIMSSLITQMIVKEKQKSYRFKPKDNGIAGICPDCSSIVSWNSYHSRFQCLGKDCCFEADEKGKRIWDNNMREENIKKMQDNDQLSV